MSRVIRLLGLSALLLALAPSAWGYGPFNHLCVVDRNWSAIYPQIQAVGPLDERRATDAVFAGAIADDLGYYPLNSNLKDLTNQTHYVRTGEWVSFLLRDVNNQRPSSRALAYAFALGVLSHYAADRMGHYYGTNVVAARLAHQELLFGARMSYERDPDTHKGVEAGFDVVSLSADCQADKLTDQFYAFLQRPAWPDGEQIYGFLKGALSKFYGYSPLDKPSDLVHALIFARRYVTRLMQTEGGPYASKRIASDQSATTPLKPDLYAMQKPEEIAKEDEWIEQQIQLGRTVKAGLQSFGFLPIFSNSFAKTQSLFNSLLQLAAVTNDQKLVKVAPDAFPNINLDTNQVSVSGRYDLADCTVLRLIEKSNPGFGARISYPPKTGDLAQFFADVPNVRATLAAVASSDNATLQTQLQNIANILIQEHKRTGNALVLDPSWSDVKFVPQDSTAADAFSGHSDALAFGQTKNICMSSKVVYWRGSVRALSLLFAASASARMASSQPDANKKAAPNKELEERRETIESYRLCDADKPAGHLDKGFCKDGEPSKGIPPTSQACVNQD